MPANVFAFHCHPVLFSCSRCPCAGSRLSRMVRVYGGQAGRTVLCLSLIKHSLLLLRIPPSSSPPSHVPVMHTGLINYSGVSRSACSVSMSSCMRTSTHVTVKHWRSVCIISNERLRTGLFLIMEPGGSLLHFPTWAWLCAFDVNCASQRCSHYCLFSEIQK